MDASARRRQRTPLRILFCGLLLLTFAEHRLAELDFDSTGVARAGDACHAALVSLESCSLAFATVRLSEPRAPPHSLPSCA